MEDGEDEDVVFEGSPIFQHLQDVGYTDFLSSKTKRSYQRKEDFRQIKMPLFGRLSEIWLHIHTFILGKRQCENVALNCVAESVAVSRLVSEDDWLVLEHFLPGGEQLHTTGHLIATPTPSWHKLFISQSIVCCLLVMLQLSWYFSWLFIILLLPMVSSVMQLYSTLCTYVIVKDVKTFLSLMRKYSVIAAKSVRLMQELDLVSKGFVLLQGSGPTGFASNVGTPPQYNKLCSALRAAVTSVMHVFLDLHHLLRQYSSQYPSVDHTFDNIEVLDFNDDYTNTQQVHVLKNLVTLSKIQLSAVITRLLLCTIHKPCVLEKLYDSRNNLFYSAQMSDAESDIASLMNNYEYTKSFWFDDREKGKSTKSYEKKKTNVYVALHSLSLHLQAALFRVQNLERDFAKEESENDGCFIEDQTACFVLPPLADVTHQLESLKNEISFCQSCYEEAETRVQRKYGVNESRVVPKMEHLGTGISEREVTCSHMEKKPPIVLYDVEQRVVEDEVFEAYIDQDYSSEQCNDNEDFWGEDVCKERKMFKQQKEQGKRVLKELQPILTNRRRMWEQREKVALEKQLAKDHQVHSNLEIQDQEIMKCEKMDGNMIAGKKKLMQGKMSGTGHHTDNLSEADHVAVTKPNEEEMDSDEERLEAYKKVKKELEEDERQRLVEVQERIGLPFITPGSTKQNICTEESTVLKLGDGKEERDAGAVLSGFVKPDKKLPKIKTPFKLEEEAKYLTDETFETCVTDCSGKESCREYFTEPTKPCTAEYKADEVLLDFGVSSIFKFDEKDQPVIFETSNVSNQGAEAVKASTVNAEEVVQSGKEEVFEHDVGKSDDYCKLDWNSFSIPSHLTETLEDRLHLFSDGSNISVQADIAAKAIAASKTFFMAENKATETYGGIGEGEELFWSTSASDSDSDTNES